MIDNLLANKTNILILRYFSRFPNQSFSAEEISKETGAGIRNIKDSIQILLREDVLKRKYVKNRVFYQFIIDSVVKQMLYNLFNEEQRRIHFRKMHSYKIISEIELKIIKASSAVLSDIILFGSVAKGKDTLGSDIDICVLIESHDLKVENELKRIAYDMRYQNEVQIHVFATDEFLAAEKLKNPLVMDILRDGISLRIGK